MKKIMTLLVALATLMVTQSAFAANDATKTDPQTAAPKKELKHQTKCPVMGGDIDSTQYTDIQGQRVYHCCSMCSEKLKADPDKYFKEAAAEGILFENIQTNCPVCGMKLEEKDLRTDYEGRRVFFCSTDCSKTFDKDPQMYLKKLDEMTKSESTDNAGMRDMKSMHKSDSNSGESHSH
ncbi:MAG TPA: YHS domain-containing protein [candidate division Zixibacteria bacterium]|nr:YHS domain-containing protein [candidate division Zixibacteria bacterium]